MCYEKMKEKLIFNWARRPMRMGLAALKICCGERNKVGCGQLD